MAELKHTRFMKGLKNLVPHYLPKPYQNYRLGKTRYQFQLYYSERRIHYEVSRVANEHGRVLEIGLHFESRSKRMNRFLVQQFQKYLFEIREELGQQVVAERWDRGWAKVYEGYPSPTLTENDQQFAAQRLAEFILVVQPLYEHIRAEA